MTEKEQLRQLLGNVNALLGAMRFSAATATGDAANIGNFASYKTFLRKYNDLAKQAIPLLPNATTLDGYDIDKIRGIGDTTWPEHRLIDGRLLWLPWSAVSHQVHPVSGPRNSHSGGPRPPAGRSPPERQPHGIRGLAAGRHHHIHLAPAAQSGGDRNVHLVEPREYALRAGVCHRNRDAAYRAGDRRRGAAQARGVQANVYRGLIVDGDGHRVARSAAAIEHRQHG